MGTGMRFFVVLAGLGFMVFAFAMIGPSLYDVLTDFFADPLGNSAVLLMLAVVAAAPFYVGVRLVRKGLRDETPRARAIGGSESVRPLAPYARAAQPPEAQTALEVEPQPSSAISVAPPVVVDVPESAVVEAPTITTASAATDAARAAPAATMRRPALAFAGLALAFLGFVIDALFLFANAINPPINGAEWGGFLFFLGVGTSLFGLGIRVARRGDPDLGRRFLSEVRARLAALGQPAVLVRSLGTSYGLAMATYLVAALVMLIWRAQSAEIGITALAIYSLFDPVLNITRPSWWTGAIVSFGVGMVLFFALLTTAAILLYPIGDAQYYFVFPLFLYIPVMGLSAIVRFVDNLRRSD